MSVLRTYRKKTDGNFGIISAIALVPMLIAIGATFDIARLSNMQRNLQDAADSAALAGAINYMQEDSSQEMKAQGEEVFKANLSNYDQLKVTKIKVNKDGDNKVKINAEAKLEPMFVNVFGFPKMDIHVSSTATVGEGIGAEVALAVDTTNSMAFGSSWNDTMGTVENILEDMKDFSGDDNFYFTLIPFQDRVNIGDQRKNWVETSNLNIVSGGWDSVVDDVDNAWSDDDSDDDDSDDDKDGDEWNANWEQNWAGCVEPRHEKVGGFDWMLTDAKPTSDKFTPTHEDAKLSDGRDLNCPDVAITGPTNNIDDVIAESKKLKKGGTGRYDVGLAWAWRAISPEWRGKWGVNNYPSKSPKGNPGKGKSEKTRKKYIVYMTDGRSNAFKLEAMQEESWGWNNGSKKAFEHIAAMCETIKEDDIEIYVLQIPGNDNSTPYFKSCASSPSHHIFVDEVEDISFAFNLIKTSLYAQVRTVK